MILSNAIAWAEELLSRQERRFDYPTSVPVPQDLKIFLRRRRDGLGYNRLAREFYPRRSFEAAKSAVVRTCERVEKYLTPEASFQRMVKAEEKRQRTSTRNRLKFLLLGCPPRL